MGRGLCEQQLLSGQGKWGSCDFISLRHGALVQGAGSNTRDLGTLTLKGLFAVFQLPLFHIWLKYTKCFTHKLVVSFNSVAKEIRKTLEPLPRSWFLSILL